MTSKRNAIVLAQNYESYISGNYHNDLVAALDKICNLFKYGRGYPGYSPEDCINDVIRKSGFKTNQIDVIIVSTSWEKEEPGEVESDPHPNICLAGLFDKKIKTIFFLNKEYKNIQSKLNYIKKNNFNLVLTVMPERAFFPWQQETNVKFLQSHFGINTEIFKNLELERIYDLTFTGSLHEQYTNKRKIVKKEIFDKSTINSNKGIIRLLHPFNPIKEKYRKYNIYWAEWSKWSVNWKNESLLPSGKEYVKLMNKSKVFFSTLSADGILGTRFFEILATGSVLLCPEDDYYGILEDGYNCTMYKNDLSDFDFKLELAVNDNDYRNEIIYNGYKFSITQTYENRIKRIFEVLFGEES